MKDKKRTMTIVAECRAVAACTVAILFAGAAMAGGPLPTGEARVDARTEVSVPAPQVQLSMTAPAKLDRDATVTRWTPGSSGGSGGVAGQSNCCEEQPFGQTGCDDPDCQALVCGQDPFCCDTHWDQACADFANANCAVCIDVLPACVGAQGNCCLGQTASPGCNNETCCTAVCLEDDFCCDFNWDSHCANIAKAVCPAHCTPEECGDEIAISCCAADVVDLRKPYCDDADCCDTVCAADAFCCNEVWDYECALVAATMCDICDEFYSNLTHFSGWGFASGEVVAADLLLMVDSGVVNEVTFSIVNFSGDPPVNTMLLDVEFDLVFMPVEVDVDGFLIEPDPDDPNAIVIPINFEGIDLPNGFFTLVTVSSELGLFNTDDLNDEFPLAMWAGLRYTNATFESTGTMANLGQVMYHPPTAGTSADSFWLEGFGFAFFGGLPDPIANFAWEVVGDDGDPTPPCPGDLTGSGSVGVPDLLALLACWGPVAPGCENADLTGSGSVGVPDLLELLAAWGPCPE